MMGNSIDTGLIVVALLVIGGALGTWVSSRLIEMQAIRAETRRMVEVMDTLAAANSRAMRLAEERRFEEAQVVLDEAIVEARVAMGVKIGVGGR